MPTLQERINARRNELAGPSTQQDLGARIDARRAQLSGDVVFEDGKGGRVIRGESGLSFTSPGYSTSDPGVIERIMQGEGAGRVSISEFDKKTIAQHPVAARGQEFVQGAPLIGEYLDEAVGVVSPQSRQGMNVLSSAMERENPIESAAINVAGGVVTSAPFVAAGAGAKAVDWVNKGKSGLGRGARAMFAGGAAGAVEGSVSMAGRGETLEDRLQNAKVGAVIGGGLGAALVPVASLAGVTAASLAQRVKKLDIRTIADEFGLSPEASRILKGYIQNDDLDAASAFLARNPDAMLAESGPATRQALDTAMQAGGEALSVGRKNVDARFQAGATRFNSKIDELFGEAKGGIVGRAKDIAKKSASARDAAYRAAYAQPRPMTGEAAQAIDASLGRIHPDLMKQALRQADIAAQADGVPNLNLLARISDDGSISFEQPLSVMDLDYIARGLNAVREAGTDKVTGGVSPEARIAGNLARDLRDALKDGVPAYAHALKLGGDKIKQTDALVMGRKLLSEATTVEDVRSIMSRATPDIRSAAADGLREALDSVMGRARTTLQDLEAGNLDFETGVNEAAQAVAALRAITTGNNVRKIAAVMGSDARALMKEVERMSDVLVLRTAVARNSATAIRQSGQQAIAAQTAPGLVRRTAGNMGNPLDAAKEVSQTLAGIDPASITAQQKAYLAEIATSLTEIRGQDAQKALAMVNRAIAGQPLKDAEAQLIGRVVGSSVAVGSYRSGQGLLRSAPQ